MPSKNKTKTAPKIKTAEEIVSEVMSTEVEVKTEIETEVDGETKTEVKTEIKVLVLTLAQHRSSFEETKAGVMKARREQMMLDPFSTAVSAVPDSQLAMDAIMADGRRLQAKVVQVETSLRGLVLAALSPILPALKGTGTLFLSESDEGWRVMLGEGDKPKAGVKPKAPARATRKAAGGVVSYNPGSGLKRDSYWGRFLDLEGEGYGPTRSADIIRDEYGLASRGTVLSAIRDLRAARGDFS